MLEAPDLVGEAVPSSWSIQKPELSGEGGSSMEQFSVRSVVHQRIDQKRRRWNNWGSRRSLAIIEDGILEVGGDARRRSFARNDNGTVNVGDEEFKRKEPTVGSSWKTIEPPTFTMSESAPNTYLVPQNEPSRSTPRPTRSRLSASLFRRMGS